MNQGKEGLRGRQQEKKAGLMQLVGCDGSTTVGVCQNIARGREVTRVKAGQDRGQYHTNRAGGRQLG